MVVAKRFRSISIAAGKREHYTDLAVSVNGKRDALRWWQADLALRFRKDSV
jgi:hypothetical protein